MAMFLATALAFLLLATPYLQMPPLCHLSAVPGYLSRLHGRVGGLRDTAWESTFWTSESQKVVTLQTSHHLERRLPSPKPEEGFAAIL